MSIKKVFDENQKIEEILLKRLKELEEEKIRLDKLKEDYIKTRDILKDAFINSMMKLIVNDMME